VTSSITNEAVDEIGPQGQGSRHRRDQGVRRHDRGGLIMRGIVSSRWCCSGRPLPLRRKSRAAVTNSNGDRPRARGADRAGSRQALLGLASKPRCPRRASPWRWSPPATPSCRRRPSGRRRTARSQALRALRPRPRPASTPSACRRAAGSTWCRTGIPQAKSLQRRHRLRRIRKTMKYELSASPFVLQVSGTKENSISIAILPSE